CCCGWAAYCYRHEAATAASRSPDCAALCRPGLCRLGLPQAAVAARPAWIGALEHRRHRCWDQSMTNISSPSAVLAAHLAVLSSISFGGFPTVLPDVHNFVTGSGWLSDREFSDIFAVSQVVPGPNMILMMSFVGLKVGGIPGAIASAFATFGPPCAMYYTSYRLWDRFRNRPWPQILRRALAPLTIGLVIAGGYVMARAADASRQRALLTVPG